jgi:hypothetical protein
MPLKTFVLAVMLSMSTSNAIVELETTTTWTGWFSDKGCAASKVRSGNISPNGTECVKKCLNEGAMPVFLSEQAKRMYVVTEHPAVIDDVGYHVEVTGVVDEDAGTIAVLSVKRLSAVPPTCGLPKKTSR